MAKTIEEKLLERGINEEDLLKFAMLEKHNSKEFRFISIINADNWGDFRKFDDGVLLKYLTEILSEFGLENIKEEFSPEENKGRFNYLGESKYKLYVGQMVASKMYSTLITPGKYKQHDHTLTLDRIFYDTFNNSKEEDKVLN